MDKCDYINSELPAVIRHFQNHGKPEIADIISHRAYRVAWTTQKEMLEEILTVFEENCDPRTINANRTLSQFYRALKSATGKI